MLDLDTWQEILDTIRKNRLRTFLTGFSVAWGIFMLIVLLGSGEGLSHGIEHQFRDDAVNSLWVYSGQTSKPHRGRQPGRVVQFANRDHDDIETRVRGVEHITSRFYIRGNLVVTRGSETGTFDVRGVHPDHLFLENTLIPEGRFLNDLDLREHRKVAVIGTKVKDALFGQAPALGGTIAVNGIVFQAVGIFTDEGGEGELEKIDLPITTAQRTYNGGERVAQIMMTTGDASVQDTQAMADTLRHRLADHHGFDPEDERAVFVSNNVEEFARFLAKVADWASP